uniref:Uncharacterized protein n=1 Tax=Anguilla anguilla TaxID=7936 RepID=A0A0E9WD14_ANGAN
MATPFVSCILLKAAPCNKTHSLNGGSCKILKQLSYAARSLTTIVKLCFFSYFSFELK